MEKKNYKQIIEEVKYFPVANNLEEKISVTYTDSWHLSRTYGGKRLHEGTDLMALINKRGYYPIISMTDGVIEKIGWLEQGGYRIGIRSPHGYYYYYAHLYCYAPQLKLGDKVIAGQFIALMGDSGYSKVEGTVGNFDVHLHLGIYYNKGEQEKSLNPYPVLKQLEQEQLKFVYKE